MSGNRQLSYELEESQRLPIHKKIEQATKKNHQPIFLLPIPGKIFQILIFDVMYKHICDNKLLTPNQLCFCNGNSTVNQLLYITHIIYTAFEEYPTRETRAVFFDTSKAFDKV